MMDAISDVSRASEIFSSVPLRSPLPDPLDLDDLLGFSEAQLKRTDCDVFGDVKYFDNNKVFINDVDSFCGKYLALLLSKKETLKKPEDVVDVDPDYESKTNIKKRDKKSVSPKGNKTTSDKKSNSRSKKKDTYPKSQKNDKTKILKKRLRSMSVENVNQHLEYIQDILQEEGNKYDTSRLTVAEYYEWLDLEPGSNREDFLKEKLGKFVEEQTLENNSPKMINNMDIKSNFPKRHEIKPFSIIGTLKNKDVPESYVQEGVSEIIEMSECNKTFCEQISKCGFVIYFINESQRQAGEALTVFNSLLNYFDENPDLVKMGQPLFILVSTFMCWASTKPLDPNNPELPFTEKDYRKRIPHPNYQLHYELEQQVIRAKENNKIDSIILTCGIPYGHEEVVFNYLFETAYNYEDLSVYCPGKNVLPIIHVENMALVIKEFIQRRYEINLPFLFVNDKLSYSLKELIRAISMGLGSGCYKTMSQAFALLDDCVSQDIYDQTMANIDLQSCYTLVNEEDIRWKIRHGFVGDIMKLIEEFIVAKDLAKPHCIIFYGSKNTKMKNLPILLSKHFKMPYLSVENVVNEYVANVIEKQDSSFDVDIKSETIKYRERGDNNFRNDIKGNQECGDILNLDGSLDIFRKLSNIKELKGVAKLTDTQKANILKKKLNENICTYHGYVLNEFPNTVHQAEILFSLDEQKNLDDSNFITMFKFPDYIIYLNESQVVGNDQNVDINEDGAVKEVGTKVEDHEDHQLHEISNFGSSIIEDTPVMKYFQKIHYGCKTIKIQVTKTDDEDEVLKTIISKFEKTNLTEQQSPSLEENSCIEVPNNLNVPEKDDHFNNMSVIEIKNDQFQTLKEQEEIILSTRSYPLLNYLIHCVYPTLTNALLQVCDQRPEDPLDFLAEYIFRENPDGRMIDPSQLKTKETYHDLRFPNIDSKTCLS